MSHTDATPFCTAAMLKNYVDKSIFIAGVVVVVQSEPQGIQITIESEKTQVHCFFQGAKAKNLENIQKDDVVIIEGRVQNTGVITGDTLTNCGHKQEGQQKEPLSLHFSPKIRKKTQLSNISKTTFRS